LLGNYSPARLALRWLRSAATDEGLDLGGGNAADQNRGIGYAPLPFFAKNLLIFAFVGSRTRRWLSLHGWCRSGQENRAQSVD